jgi:CRP/FNR family transcriptional regulator, dissimilatory nitrate respiration regulator
MAFRDTELSLAKSSQILKDIPSDALGHMLDSGANAQLHLSANEVFASEGDVRPGLFLVVDGVIELFISDDKGRDKVVDFVQAGEILAQETLLTAQPLPYSARALTDAAVLHLPDELIADWQGLYPAFSRLLLSNIAQRAAYVGNDMLTLRTKKAPARLVCYLLCHFNKAPQTPDGSYSLDLPFPRNKLASRLGITNSHLSRTFRELQDAGLIVPQGRGYFIPDVPALSKHVCPAGCDFGQGQANKGHSEMQPGGREQEF